MQHGYTAITREGWIGFDTTLTEAPWSSVPDLPTTTEAEREALLDSPIVAVQKAWMRAAIRELILASGLTLAMLEEADADWDALERQLHHQLSSLEAGRDLPKKEAAGRLRVKLLKGGTTAHTRLPYQDEVDFGRTQIATAAQDSVKADLETTGLRAHFDQLAAATEALAAALKAHPAHRPSFSARAATQRCVSAFNLAHTSLLRLHDGLQEGSARRAELGHLIASLDTFVARFSAQRT